MSLSKQVYKSLQDIVGADNISQSPAILDSYAFQLYAEIARPNQSKFMIRPEAVLLPGSTEEVQSIVKLCNENGIKVKAYSTGWYFYCAPQSEGVIQLDMRRMDRIIKLDSKNMFAIVEPYVTCAQLQAEAMKVGLNCNMIGAGASTSILASATSYAGPGPSTYFMGHNSENLLALEWVMPNGEILRTGSLDSGDNWFCGEGPGPSLRGLTRGAIGARGGMGVFTKIAIKLSPWPGPAVLPVEGTVPAYKSSLPENFRAYTLVFPDWKAFAEAHYKLWDFEDIGYIAHRQFNMMGNKISPAFWMMYIDPSKQLDDLEEYVDKPEIQKLVKETEFHFQIILAGQYPGDIEYQEKVLDRLLADTGGYRLVWPWDDEDMQKFTFLYFNRLGHKNINNAYGTFCGSGIQEGTPDNLVEYSVPVAMEALERNQKLGGLVDCGADSTMGGIGGLGGGGIGCLEEFTYYDPHDKESVKGEIEFLKDAERTAIKYGIPPGKENFYLSVSRSDEELEQGYSHAPQPAMFHWQWKIKQMFDPNNVGDRLYPTLKPEDS